MLNQKAKVSMAQNTLRTTLCAEVFMALYHHALVLINSSQDGVPPPRGLTGGGGAFGALRLRGDDVEPEGKGVHVAQTRPRVCHPPASGSKYAEDNFMRGGIYGALSPCAVCLKITPPRGLTGGGGAFGALRLRGDDVEPEGKGSSGKRARGFAIPPPAAQNTLRTTLCAEVFMALYHRILSRWRGDGKPSGAFA
jgi:predicted secreted protein